MSREKSNPPALAIWLLQHVCPGSNKEALSGDLLEQFREGRSSGWFWQQVLIAIAIGVLTELRLHWPQICYAIAGTVMLGFLGKTFSRSSAIGQLWVWSKSLQWPFSSVSVFDLSRAALLALAVSPILAALLLLNRACGWLNILRAFGISFPLIVVGDLVTFLWVSSHPVITQQQVWMVNVFGVSRIFSTLLASAWLGCRLPPRSNSSGKHSRV